MADNKLTKVSNTVLNDIIIEQTQAEIKEQMAESVNADISIDSLIHNSCSTKKSAARSRARSI